MYFYQAQWWDEENKFGELRSTREEAIDDLKNMGYDVNKLVEDEKHFGMMYADNFGIAVTRI